MVSPAFANVRGEALDTIKNSAFVESWVRVDWEKHPGKEIEEDIVEELVRRHRAWIESVPKL